jgi:GMP synthase (glutamine-hydrolysing)
MTQSANRRELTRRTFLQLAGLSTLLAACGEPLAIAGPETTAVASPTMAPLPSTAPTRTPTPTATYTPTWTPSPFPSDTATSAPAPTATPSPPPAATDTPAPTPTRGPLRVISLIHGPYRALIVDHVLDRYGFEGTSVRVDQGEVVPDLRNFDAVVFAGGEWGPDEFDEPFFEAERVRIFEALDAGVPILGICLGNQLLAHWLGGEVTQGQWEIGWIPVQVNEEGLADPLLAGLGESFYAFLWHGDKITRLPDDAVLLASTPKCPVQAFRLRNQPVWGVQFNPQYDPVIAEGVIRAATTLPKYGFDLDEMVETGYREYDDLAGTIFGNFFRYVMEGESIHATPGNAGGAVDRLVPR